MTQIKSEKKRPVSLFEMSDREFAEILAQHFQDEDQQKFSEKLKKPYNQTVIKNAQIVGTAMKEKGLADKEVRERVKQYLRLNFK